MSGGEEDEEKNYFRSRNREVLKEKDPTQHTHTHMHIYMKSRVFFVFYVE